MVYGANLKLSDIKIIEVNLSDPAIVKNFYGKSKHNLIIVGFKSKINLKNFQKQFNLKLVKRLHPIYESYLFENEQLDALSLSIRIYKIYPDIRFAYPQSYKSKTLH